jgi:general secretion pathway protein G
MQASRGYTLLEILVVVAVLALATAMVAPSGYRLIESWQRQSQADTLLGELSTLATANRDSGAELYLAAGTYRDRLGRIDLPAGWAVVLLTDLRVLANGVCLGTRGEAMHDGLVIGFEMNAPYCQARRTEPAS